MAVVQPGSDRVLGPGELETQVVAAVTVTGGRILRLAHVHHVHDLHASLVATGLPVMTVHVVVAESRFHDGHLGPMLDELQACIATDFDVTHSTIQFESAAHAGHEHRTHD